MVIARRQANAAADAHRCTACEFDGPGSYLDAALDDRSGLALVGHAREEPGEFVSAEPGGRVVAPQFAAQPVAHCAQDFVAGMMAKRVVDRLEAIQVQVADSQALPVPLGLCHGLPQQLLEQVAIGQARQAIVQRLVLGALPAVLELVEVDDHPEELGVGQGRGTEIDPELVAGAGAHLDLRMEAAIASQCLVPERTDVIEGGVVRVQQAHRRTGHGAIVIAQDAVDRPIGPQDVPPLDADHADPLVVEHERLFLGDPRRQGAGRNLPPVLAGEVDEAAADEKQHGARQQSLMAHLGIGRIALLRAGLSA